MSEEEQPIQLLGHPASEAQVRTHHELRKLHLEHDQHQTPQFDLDFRVLRVQGLLLHHIRVFESSEAFSAHPTEEIEETEVHSV